MTRNLKALGLAIVAALALSAIAGSVAQAEELNLTSSHEPDPIALHAGQTIKHVFTLAGGRKTECDTATFTGQITGAAEEVTIEPTYTNCTVEIAGDKLPATITFPSTCDYLFTLPKTVAGAQVKGRAHLECSSGEVQIHVYEKGKEHKAGLPAAGGTEVCTYKIGTQTNLETLSYENSGGKVVVTANVSGIAYTRSLGTITNCGAASSTATYVGTSTVTASFIPPTIHVG